MPKSLRFIRVVPLRKLTECLTCIKMHGNTNVSWHICCNTMKDNALFQGEMIMNVNASFQSHFLQNHKRIFNQTYKLSLSEGNSSLYNKRTFQFSKGVNHGIILVRAKLVYWSTLFLGWALWPMDLLFQVTLSWDEGGSCGPNPFDTMNIKWLLFGINVLVRMLLGAASQVSHVAQELFVITKIHFCLI